MHQGEGAYQCDFVLDIEELGELELLVVVHARVVGCHVVFFLEACCGCEVSVPVLESALRG